MFNHLIKAITLSVICCYIEVSLANPVEISKVVQED